MVTKSISGGDKLQAALEKVAKKLKKSAALKVGFLSGATYPSNSPVSDESGLAPGEAYEGGVSVAMVAAIQEFGAPKASIPPRPFFRSMVAQESPHWGDDLAKLLKSTDYDASKSLALMGERISSDLQMSIIATDSPALSPITLMLRKMRSEDQTLVMSGTVVGQAAARVAAGEDAGAVSNKVLVDTGHLLNSVGYQVK